MLTGPVPAWLNGMTEMRELWLWGNQLSGAIPDLSGMTSLQKLKLAANNLEGGVPGASALAGEPAVADHPAEPTGRHYTGPE